MTITFEEQCASGPRDTSLHRGRGIRGAVRAIKTIQRLLGEDPCDREWHELGGMLGYLPFSFRILIEAAAPARATGVLVLEIILDEEPDEESAQDFAEILSCIGSSDCIRLRFLYRAANGNTATPMFDAD